jgi:hypothetical protein
MDTDTFIIKSVYVQNGIMLTFLGVAIAFLVHSVFKKRPKHIAVFSVWVLLVIWFFNSPFFGFSAVSAGPEGININYGVLSFQNSRLPLDSTWEVKTYLGGIRKNRRLYYIIIGGHRSMKVKWEGEPLLREIGESIDRFRSRRSKKEQP